MIDTVVFVLLVTTTAGLPLGHWLYFPPLRTWRRR